MSTTKEPKTKTTKRYRVKIGESYACLSYDFSDKGALVKCNGPYAATEFKTNVSAGNAIIRTREIQSQIAESMHAGWRAFDRLAYKETPTVEEFQVTMVE